MFDSRSFKKSALEQLKGRWTVPCIATLILIAIFVIIGESSFMTNGKLGEILSIFIYGSSTIAFTNIFILLFLSRDAVTFSDFINGFSDFLRGFLGMLWVTLWLLLWSMLFIIPAFIKAFAYSQIFFILSDNPKIGVIKAMNISKIITKGHKADLFVLMVSFIGWHLLGIISCGILFVWIIPYMNMTLTNAYYYLKQEAIRTGVLTPADFEK
ncbi:DUF975 family protein [Treponema sp.]|uniref:DUF975 family protein n=1 Tax=Treponema sp. TaxID=166 RepID=UPI00298EB929|nr:DUF975 family protein [Treponema sp.]MCQ2240759.1 DUF975 family protein [Treponema sp.]